MVSWNVKILGFVGNGHGEEKMKLFVQFERVEEEEKVEETYEIFIKNINGESSPLWIGDLDLVENMK